MSAVNYEDLLQEEVSEERKREAYGQYLLNDSDVSDGLSSFDWLCFFINVFRF